MGRFTILGSMLAFGLSAAVLQPAPQYSVVRTPNGNDYGKDLVRQHYQQHAATSGTTAEASAKPGLGPRGSVGSGPEAPNSAAEAEPRADRGFAPPAPPPKRRQATPACSWSAPDGRSRRSPVARIDCQIALISLTLCRRCYGCH